MKVRKNSTYVYDPCFWDVADKPYGVGAGILKSGDVVKVVHLHGCPPPNTMAHCHIQTMAGQFAGLVHTGSLHKKGARAYG